MFELGFLGTKAAMYMDIVTIYFGLVPFMLIFSIIQAIKKKYQLHYKMQLFTFILTILMVIIFEVGVRLDGGLNAFMKTSTVDYNFMAILMVIHIIIAVVTVVLWSIILYGAIKKFKVEKVSVDHNHKFFGKIVFLGMSITSALGISIYYLLFIM